MFLWLTEPNTKKNTGNEIRWDRLLRSCGVLTPDVSSHLARMARVEGMPLAAIRFLSEAGNLSGELLVEYCESLLHLGFLNNAESRLRELDWDRHVTCRLLMAKSQLGKHEFGSAAGLLSEYVKHPSVFGASRIEGQALLARAFLEQGEAGRAKVCLDAIRGPLPEHLGSQLRLLVTETRLWVDLKNADFPRMQSGLKLFGENPSRLKWEAILQLAQSDDPSFMKMLRPNFVARGRWRDLWEMDTFLCQLGRDKEAFLRLYFGSPYASVRRQLMGRAPWTWNVLIPPYWRRALGTGEGRTFHCNDFFKSGTIPHRMVVTLASSLYGPPSLGWLFERAFPGEEFQYITGRHRIHEGIRLCRAGISGSPLKVLQRAGRYELQGEDNAGIWIPREEDELSYLPQVRQLKRLIPKGSRLTSSEVAEALGVSQRTAARLLTSAVRSGLLHRTGKGKSTRYEMIEDR